jgi:DNA-binding NarL/FixJ family response regulator
MEWERTAASVRVDSDGSLGRGRRQQDPQEILRLMSDGLANLEIASRVDLTENAVTSHAQERLEARHRVQAAARAISDGWL